MHKKNRSLPPPPAGDVGAILAMRSPSSNGSTSGTESGNSSNSSSNASNPYGSFSSSNDEVFEDPDEESRELPPLPDKPRSLRRPVQVPSHRRSPSQEVRKTNALEPKFENKHLNMAAGLPRPKANPMSPRNALRHSRSHGNLTDFTKQDEVKGENMRSPIMKDDPLDMAEFHKQQILSIIRGKSVINEVPSSDEEKERENKDFDTISKEKLFETILNSSASIDNGRFLRCFLLVHRQFMDSYELILFLFNRFFDKSENPSQKTKILDIIKTWINLNREDLEDIKIRVLLSNWHANLMLSGRTIDIKWGETIKSVWESPQEQSRDLTPTIQRNIGVKESKKVLKLKDNEFTEKIPEFYLACQMTALEYDYYEMVDINDLLKRDWHKNNNTLVPMRDHFNKIVQWIASEILSHPHNSTRSTLIIKFIKIADVLMRLNNFNGVMEIYKALTLPCIIRLTRAWKKIPMEMRAIWDTIENLLKPDLTGSYKLYDNLVRKADGCLIPCLYIVLFEIEQIDKSFHKLANGESTIFNYDKISALGEIVESFRRHQAIQYNISKDRKVQTFIKEQVRIESTRRLNEYSQRFEPSLSSDSISSSRFAIVSLPASSSSLPSANSAVSSATLKADLGGLENNLWFFRNIQRKEAEEILSSCDYKSFLVRNASSQPGSLAVSHCSGKRAKVVHTLLNSCPGGWFLSGSTGVYKSLSFLIENCPELYGYKPAWNSLAKQWKAENKQNLPKEDPSFLHSLANSTNLSKLNLSKVDRFFGNNRYAHLSDHSNDFSTLRKKEEGDLAIQTGNLLRLVELIREGLPLDNIFRNGQNLFHIAADYNNPRLIDFVMEYDLFDQPDINGRDDVGWTPLHTACYKGHLRVIEALLDFGADVNFIANSGATSLHYLVRTKVDEDHDSFLRVLDLMISKGANVNCQDVNLNTPLLQACSTPNYLAIEMLLERGGDPHLKNSKGESAYSIIPHLSIPPSKTLDRLLQKSPDSDPSFSSTVGDLILQHEDLVVEGQLLSGPSSNTQVSHPPSFRLENDKPPPFNTYFYRKEHYDLIGMDQRDGVILLSYAKTANSEGMYRYLVRTKKSDDIIDVPVDVPINELTTSLRIFASADFKSIENTNFAELLHQKEDEMISKSVTSGVLFVPEGYYTDNKFLTDVPHSASFEEFLQFLGQKIPRKIEMREYSLEESGSVGDYAVSAKYLGNEVIFNVSTVVPKVERVDAILNNRTTVVFLEASTLDASFLLNHHDNSVILVVKPFKNKGQTFYRFAVCRRNKVKEFGPPISIPAVYPKEPTFRSLLLTKLLNGARSMNMNNEKDNIMEASREKTLYEIHSQSRNLPLKATVDLKAEELYRIDKNKLLGSGATCIAYYAINRRTKEAVCVKVVEPEILKSEQIRKTIEKEVTLLRKMDHPSIVKVLDDYYYNSSFYIVLEICLGGTLFDDVKQNTTFSENQAAKVMHQILSAVDHAHMRGISHRDLKPQNILFADKMKRKIKLIDFGYGKDVAESNLNNTVAGTLDYVAIEMWDGEYDYFKVDVWSCGCIAYFLLFGHTLHSEYSSMNAYHESLKYDRPIDRKTSLSPEGRTFLSRLLEADPVRRVSAAEGAKDPWILKHIQNNSN